VWVGSDWQERADLDLIAADVADDIAHDRGGCHQLDFFRSRTIRCARGACRQVEEQSATEDQEKKAFME
jgi:hypothetical protein